MFRNLKGYLGSVPLRLVTTVLVAILIPSLLVTGIGLIAVFQADKIVKAQSAEVATRKLERLRAATGTEWQRRLEHFAGILRDAPSRLRGLGELRTDPYVRDVFVDDGGDLRPVPPRGRPPIVPGSTTDPRLAELRRREVGPDVSALATEYEAVYRSSADPAVELAALLGAVRTSRRSSPRDTSRYIDLALRRFGDAVDETGMPWGIVLRVLEVEARPEAGADRDRAVTALAQSLRDPVVSEDVRALYSRRFEKLFAALGERTEPAFDANAVAFDPSTLLVAHRNARRANVSGGLVTFVAGDLAGGLASVFSAETDRPDVFVLVVLDEARFLADISWFLSDIGIPPSSLVLPESGAEATEEQVLAGLSLPQPFFHRSWTYRPEPGSLRTRFLEFFTAATFIWAVIILVLTILTGTFVSLRSVLREMRTARMKSDFVSFISHELKTPLSAIRMLSETLVEGRVEDAEDESMCLRMIDRESARLQNLIDRVLEYSKIQNEQKVFERQSSSMREVVDEAVEIFSQRSKTQPREIEVNTVQHISKIRMDRPAMVELVLNLLSNAAKYSPPEERIVINLRESIDEITLEVIDRGIGIRKRDQRRVFDKFYRADDLLTRDIEGYGLGLSFARYIAKQHKGVIKVSSQINSGSTFTLQLKKLDVLAE